MKKFAVVVLVAIIVLVALASTLNHYDVIDIGGSRKETGTRQKVTKPRHGPHTLIVRAFCLVWVWI